MTAHHILVVEDSRVVRHLLRKRLEAAGFMVTTSASAEQALELLRTEAYDLVTTDLKMDGISGFQLCRLIRANSATSHLPIVVLTSSSDVRSRFWSKHAGADGFLVKGDNEGLVTHIAELLQGADVVVLDASRSTVPSSPLEQLANVLEHQLSDAVIASDIRCLSAHLDDLPRLMSEEVRLAGSLLNGDYIVLRCQGIGARQGVYARGPWSSDGPEALSLVPELPTDIVLDEEASEGDVAFQSRLSKPLSLSGKDLGELTLYTRQARIAPDDVRLLEILADGFALVMKSALLMAEVEHVASHDPLTGLLNRRAGLAAMEIELARVRRHAGAMSVGLLDIDHFKSVNDTYGHGVGDDVLRQVAALCKGTLRQTDSMVRWGGEEFIAVFGHADAEQARMGAERLRQLIEADGATGTEIPSITTSIGVATLRAGETIEQLIERADQALYEAKGGGRNRVVVAASEDESS